MFLTPPFVEVCLILPFMGFLTLPSIGFLILASIDAIILLSIGALILSFIGAFSFLLLAIIIPTSPLTSVITTPFILTYNTPKNPGRLRTMTAHSTARATQ